MALPQWAKDLGLSEEDFRGQITTKVLEPAPKVAEDDVSYPFMGKLDSKSNLHKAVCYLKFGEGYKMRDLAATFRMSFRDLYRILEEHEPEGGCDVCKAATDVPDW